MNIKAKTLTPELGVKATDVAKTIEITTAELGSIEYLVIVLDGKEIATVRLKP